MWVSLRQTVKATPLALTCALALGCAGGSATEPTPASTPAATGGAPAVGPTPTPTPSPAPTPEPRPTGTPTPPTDASVFATPESVGRFLVHATFGPSKAEIDALVGTSASTWFKDQLARPATLILPKLLEQSDLNQHVNQRGASNKWWDGAISAEDQLRQRMAFALSQILVVSAEPGSLATRPLTVAQFADVLNTHALGNYRTILEEATYAPAMSLYLTYFQNSKGDRETGSVPDENYAREIMQLFTIGLTKLNMDGTPILDEAGNEIETYDNADVSGLARVFTGLASDNGDYRYDTPDTRVQYKRLAVFEEEHSPLEKSFLGLTIPAETSGVDSIDLALDHLMAQPETPPFLARQLIQRFTTSNPSPGYIERVATAFATGAYTLPDGSDVGSAERGDLTATLAAILFDREARSEITLHDPTFGKVREPAIRFTHWARAFGIKGTEDTNAQRRLAIAQIPRFLGQAGYRAPSVFNFYRPGYIAPGSATGEAGLTAPELQIVTTITSVAYVNFMSDYIRGQAPALPSADPTAFKPDYATELALADQPEALVNRLDAIFTHGTLSDETRGRMIEMMNAIPLNDDDELGDRDTRVHTAVLMIMTSPDYLVQR